MNDQAKAFGEARQERPAEELARADIYGLLASLLAGIPTKALLDQLSAILGDETDFGRAVDELGAAARIASKDTVHEEFEALFIGLGRGELVPHASFYLTGFLNERPLAKLRADLKTLGVERTPENKVPEDHIASLCEVMSGMIRGEFSERGALCQRTFFKSHLAPWAETFFDDLAKAKSAHFYAPVGKLGAALMRIEDVAFEMAA